MNGKTFRNSSMFLRNEFVGSGKWGFPFIKKQELDVTNIELIACSNTRPHDERNCHKGVHFFVDDYRFEGIYHMPDRSLDKFKQYKFLLSPDFSLYNEMDLWRQIESVGHAHWVAAFWQDRGLTVIPTVSWSTASSFEFCFDSIECGSIVAVSTVGCKNFHVYFMRGYEEMIRIIQPSKIICLGKPFPEMKGDITVVDYWQARKVVR